MAVPSKGAQHYVMILIPSLLRDIQKLGLAKVIARSELSEQEITTLYFEFASISHSLPSSPDSLTPMLWDGLLYCVQIMTALVNEASNEDLARAREAAVQKYLPHARQSVQSEFEAKKSQGTLDFRLAGIARLDTSPEHSAQVCMEAIRLERDKRFASVQRLKVNSLNPHQAVVVTEAKATVAREIAKAVDNSCHLDLMIRLLDLLRLVLLLAQTAPEELDNLSDSFTVDNIVLGLGNILYRQELDLSFNAVPARLQQPGQI